MGGRNNMRKTVVSGEGLQLIIQKTFNQIAVGGGVEPPRGS